MVFISKKCTYRHTHIHTRTCEGKNLLTDNKKEKELKLKNSVQCNPIIPATWSVPQIHPSGFFSGDKGGWKPSRMKNKTWADVPTCVTSNLPQLSTGTGFHSHICNPCMASIWWGLLWLESLVSAEGSTDTINSHVSVNKQALKLEEISYCLTWRGMSYSRSTSLRHTTREWIPLWFSTQLYGDHRSGVSLCCNPITIAGYGTDVDHDIDTHTYKKVLKSIQWLRSPFAKLKISHLGKFGEVGQTENFSVPIVHIYHKVIMHL